MTFAELLDEVMENLRGSPQGNTVQRGEIKRLMNLAMREISLKTGLPTAYVDIPATGFVTGRFAIPNVYHPEGILYAEVVEVQQGGANVASESMKNRQIAILSVSEANAHHPKWEDDEYAGPPFLLWNPLNQNEGILPVGITSAKYRFLLKVVPDLMTEDQHEPFAWLDYCADPPARTPGAMPGWHRVLAHHVTYEVLQRLGDERWQAFFARYRDMESMIFNQGTQHDVFYPQWRGSRGVRRYA